MRVGLRQHSTGEEEHNNDRAKLKALSSKESKDLESTIQGHQKASFSFSVYTAQFCNFASISCPTPFHPRFCVIQDSTFGNGTYTRQRLKARRPSLKSPQGGLESTQDSLENWDEANDNSIQGVDADDSIGTSISSVSRETEPAISHLPQAGCDPELFQFRKHSMPKGSPKLAVAPITPPASNSKVLLAGPQFICSHNSFPIDPTVIVLDNGGLEKREAEAIIVDKTNRIQKLEIVSSNAKSHFL